VDAGSEQRKRARSGSDLEQGPFSADVLNTLKKLRAAGPAPMPSQAGVPTAAPVTLNGASLHRLPGATVPDRPRAVPPTSSSASTSDPMRRKDLFRNTAVTALGTSAISSSTGGGANGPARVGVIKKRVNALVLERDSSGAAESPVSPRQQSVPSGAGKASRSVAPQAEERPVSSSENVKRDSSTAAHTNRRRPSFAPPASSELRYSPGKVRVAGPGELDTSYRLDPAEAAAVPVPYFAELASGSAGDTAESASGFSGSSSCNRGTDASNGRGPEMEEGEVAEEGKEGLRGRRGTARRARGDSPVSDNSKSSSRSRDSSHSSASRSSSGGANSLLGTGDGDYEDEDDAAGEGGSLRGSEEEGYEVGEEEDSLCDEGLLCCNDDQGSTCSATALEEGDSWGRRSARRRRVPALSYEGYAAGGVDRSAADRPFFDPDALLFNGSSAGPAASAGSLRELHRDNSSSGSLRSAHAASSSEDDGSDFEVMMMRRRGVSSGVPDSALQNGVGLGMGTAAVGGGALAWMATLSDEDELVGDS
jgi:hypothetical protein